ETAREVIVVETAVGIVTLNQSARRREVFRDRQQQRRVVVQLEWKLYEAFSKSRFTDDQRAVVILKRAGNDFRRRSRIAVDQNDHGNAIRILVDCRIRLRTVAEASSLRNDHLPALQEGIRDANGLNQQAAAIASEVEHQHVHAFAVQFLERLVEFVGRGQVE